MPRLIRLLPIAILAVAAAILYAMYGEYLSFDTLRDQREALLAYRDSHYAAAVLIFLAVYVAIVATSIPGATIISLTGGFLFSIFPGLLLNVMGATVGATLLFLAVRFGFGDALVSRIDSSSGRVKRIKDGIDENQWSVLFAMRLLPLVPFFVANLLPALMGVPLYRYVVTTALGIIPGTFLYTSAGAGLGAVFDAGELPDASSFLEPRYLVIVILVVCAALVPSIWKRWQGKRTPQ